MLARSAVRIVRSSARHVSVTPRACTSFVDGLSWSPSSLISACSAPPTAILPQRQLHDVAASCRRYLSSDKRRPRTHVEEEFVDVTPVGNKPGEITREAIEQAEAAEDLADDISAGSPSDWGFDESTEGEEADARRAEELGEEEEDDNPPTPILDAYEKSRDPVEMERLIKMSFDSLPERAGPQRYNHKRREKQRFKTIRRIKGKEKAQRIAAYERKLQKRRDRKARELALFATWREKDAEAKQQPQ